ncbi:MAG: aromatic amino acid hydroxylase [Bdellovibrionales bacterium]|nr:aromatic amino acid hydroxylase [Bdellovibrionales bacterium]
MAPKALETIPEHLREYITDQNPDLYTFIDHASWRYIMRVSKKFFAETAHPLYLHGLEATGISTERIPLVSEMDSALKRIGWRAVAINGFIPPGVFLEFQSLKILAIACDMRKLENLGYTPSPDIVHEAAGHAPIVADPGYRAYLEAYGEVSRNAIISKYDVELYDAIFNLSEIKEDPNSTEKLIADAQARFETVAKKESIPSEAALLTRMAWWTTEYGLVGKLDRPLIYGAGLLSSVSESYNCLKPTVKKIPFSLQATIDTKYDITSQQPQLFVAKDFAELTTALNEFADSMAFRRGGAYGLETAVIAQNTVTAVLDTGIQVVGTIVSLERNAEGEEMGFTITGPKQIAFHDKAHDELTQYRLGNTIYIPLFELQISISNIEDLKRKLHTTGLHTKAGHRILGQFVKEADFSNHLGKMLVLENVKIIDRNDKVIFEEFQKPYPLIVGHRVTSVFGGAADRREFALRNSTRSKKVDSHKTNLTDDNKGLNDLYRTVREFRESGEKDVNLLEPIHLELNSTYQNDWLLRLEVLELYKRLAPNSVYAAQILKSLASIAEKFPENKDLIKRGLELIK